MVTKDSLNQVLEKHLSENPNLLNSAIGNDIVLFFGKQGCGKSTIINFLTDSKIAANDEGHIILTDPNDPFALKINSTGETETQLPRFARKNNLLFYEIPSFCHEKNSPECFINACLIKHIVESSNSVRLVFILSQDELSAEKGKSLKEINILTKKLFPNNDPDKFNILILSKSEPRKIKQKFMSFLQSKSDQAILASWINIGKLFKMSHPEDGEIDYQDRQEILDGINSINPQSIKNVNIDFLYTITNDNIIKGLYAEELASACISLVDQKLSESIEPVEKKNYVTNRLSLEILPKIETTPLLFLMKPATKNLFKNVYDDWNSRVLPMLVGHKIEKLDKEIEEMKDNELAGKRENVDVEVGKINKEEVEIRINEEVEAEKNTKDVEIRIYEKEVEKNNQEDLEIRIHEKEVGKNNREDLEIRIHEKEVEKNNQEDLEIRIHEKEVEKINQEVLETRIYEKEVEKISQEVVETRIHEKEVEKINQEVLETRIYEKDVKKINQEDVKTRIYEKEVEKINQEDLETRIYEKEVEKNNQKVVETKIHEGEKIENMSQEVVRTRMHEGEEVEKTNQEVLGTRIHEKKENEKINPVDVGTIMLEKISQEEEIKIEETKIKDEDETKKLKTGENSIENEQDLMMRQEEDYEIIEKEEEKEEEKKIVDNMKHNKTDQVLNQFESEYENLAKQAKQDPSFYTQTLSFILKQKITILNFHHNMTIFLSNDKEGKDRIAEGKKKSEERSFFTIEVSNKGFMLKNKKFNEYLFVTKNYRYFGNRIVEGNSKINDRSYFDIILMKNGYVIKNKNTNEFLFLSDKEYGGDKVLSSNPNLTERSFFNLVKN
ncbi:hypothetical protein SteCoe_28426 [Stentor coeruleus]|uniref:Uncharacterized protein n=1 Tax=Stentor coeruleus TaxID=5963 RepID=A0A1R2B8A3_9CILI|nr:hypothetical protein SteCoe_28426 [Stentor coeruleus]